MKSTSRLPWPTVLAVALVVGIVGNVLVRSDQGPGLNALLFFLTLAVAIGTVARAAGHSPSREAWSWFAGGILFAAGLALRASPALQFAAFVAAAASFALPAYRAGASWMKESGASEYIEALAGAIVYSGLGGVRVVAGLLSRPDVPATGSGSAPAGAPGPDSTARDAPSLDPDSAPTGMGRVAAVLRGLLLAAPLLFVFGALFVGADRVFENLIVGLVGEAVEQWAEHVLVTGILAWLAAGYLTGFLAGTRVRGAVERGMDGYGLRRPSVGIVETGIALGLVDLLFAVFVVIQLRYLFGGAGLVEVTPGLTYAEYAREGFGQLAIAAALVLPTLLVTDWLLRPSTPRHRAVFRALGGLQLLLLILVIISAFQRVRAYQEAYGLTESRVYGVVFLGWLTVLSVWFGVTVLRDRRERFAFPALLSGLAVVAMLFVANPDARIARTNLERAGAAATADSVDAAYLASLSADAVPVLLAALPQLPEDLRCHLAERILLRWNTDREMDWRSWNLAIRRTRDAVRSRAGELQRMVGDDPGCSER